MSFISSRRTPRILRDRSKRSSGYDLVGCFSAFGDADALSQSVIMTRRFSIVGLGKLGASMAAAIASRGHEVIGVDVNHRAVDAINQGRAPVQETGLQALIEENRP